MGNFTTVPDVSVGESFPPSLWESAIMNNLNLGVARQLADTTLAASAATVTFSSIPATFAHLLLVSYARTTSGNVDDLLNAYFNGDTGANYDAEGLWVNGTSTLVTQSYGSTVLQAGDCAGGAAGASLFASSICWIPQYAGAAGNKDVVVISAQKSSTSSGGLVARLTAGFWRSSAAINQITLLPGSGSFATSSRFSLYGLPS